MRSGSAVSCVCQSTGKYILLNRHEFGMVSVNTRGLLAGRDDRQSRRWSGVVVVVFLGSLLLFAAVKELTFLSVLSFLWWEGFALMLGGLIVIQAYSSGGLLLSWGLAFAGVAGTMLNYGGIGLTSGPPSLGRLLELTVIGGLAGAATLGTMGFLLGAGLRRLVR